MIILIVLRVIVILSLALLLFMIINNPFKFKKQKFEQKGVVMCLTHIPLKNSIRLGLTCFSQ